LKETDAPDEEAAGAAAEAALAPEPIAPEPIAAEPPRPAPKKKKKKKNPTVGAGAAPSLPEAPGRAAPEQDPAVIAGGLPLFTTGIAAGLVLAFGAEVALGIGKGSALSPSIDTIVGGAVGFGLLRTWPVGQSMPRFGRAASIIAIAGAALYALSFGLVQSHYAAFAAGASVELLPNEKLGALKPSDAKDLLLKYPQDPRAHWLAAEQAFTDGDTKAAEKHLREALTEEGVLKRSFPDRKLEGGIRATLARLLDAEHRTAEAREVARPACDLEMPDLDPFCR
jgi:hypothetical protein